MIPWVKLASTEAMDGKQLELRKRGDEYLIVADGLQLMSSEDEGSSRELALLGCEHLKKGAAARVLVGGLGMGYSQRAALDCVGRKVVVEVCELVPAVVEWNRNELGALAKFPLDDPRTELHVEDVRQRIDAAAARYDAILLDVDNGPIALAHKRNNALYSVRGIQAAWGALKPGGVFGLWSFSDDKRFTTRLEKQGFEVRVRRVEGSRKGRGRYHVIWIARRPEPSTNLRKSRR
ncbi:MAG: spermidine synthase [Deltaproteobacteria bacterium]|nr:spermidine synthase [Deltaproteobacteria bacterium]